MTTHTFFDPLRRKEVAATPEEHVRQWFIGVLNSVHVPQHLMMSEAAMTFGSKRWRADILVYDRTGKPLAVVECKRPEVDLDPEVAGQALRYNMVLDVRWLILTNGERTLVFRRKGDSFAPCDRLPDYEEMTCRL